jgi:hypothetical protein
MLALLLVAGCRELDAPTAPSAPAGPAAQPLLGGLVGTVTKTTQKLTATLLMCQPLPAARVEQRVGPAGGVLQVGPHRLAIPRGALSRQVTITAEVPSDRVNSIRFSPEGLRFAQPAQLTMSYANCNLAILLPKRIVYTTESLSLLEILRSVDNVGQKTVSAPLDHFSRYAVAW